MTLFARHGKAHVWVHVATLAVAFLLGFAAAGGVSYLEFQHFKAAHACHFVASGGERCDR